MSDGSRVAVQAHLTLLAKMHRDLSHDLQSEAGYWRTSDEAALHAGIADALEQHVRDLERDVDDETYHPTAA